MRITEKTPTVLIHVRVPESLKNEIDAISDEYGISSAAFIRVAAEEKIERIRNPRPLEPLTRDEIADLIRSIVNK